MSGDSTSLRQEFTTELESIFESDEAYGSNVQVLTYSLKEDVISGKFKDSWNNRVYEFIVDTNGISYKPAIKLDSFSVDEAPLRLDSYSEGYASLFEDDRFDGKLTGKRVKKPKCGVTSYGCGFSCVGLIKTCRISASGGKTGSVIGKERLNKLIAKAGKLYAEGNKGGAVATSAAANKITEARGEKARQLVEARKEKLAKRQPPAKETPSAKSTNKPQEKKSAKPKPDPTTNSKTLTVDQETFNIKFPSQEVARQYGIGGPVDRARAVIDFVKNPKTFTSLSVGDQAGFLDNATTVHGVGDKNWDEQLEKSMVANNPERKLGAESSNVRAQGAKQIWDNLTPSQKSELANELNSFNSKLAEKPTPGIISEFDKFENRYVQQLATEIRKLIK